jgi:hypothetical protein
MITLDPLWSAFDVPDVVWHASVVASWPQGTFDWLRKHDLVVPGPNATHAACPHCGDGEAREVLAHRAAGGAVQHHLVCPECWRVPVRPESLQQWQPDFHRLARLVKELLREVAARATEREPQRLWRLCATPWKGKKPREVWMARNLAAPDGRALLEKTTLAGQPIVFIGLSAPPAHLLTDMAPALVSLASVLSVRDGSLELDHELLASLVADADHLMAHRDARFNQKLLQFVSQQVSRTVSEGPLDDAILAQHREGKSIDDIAETLQRNGTPKHRSTVARNIQKKKRPIGVSGVPSSNSIVRSVTSQPRDITGRRLREAQPKEGQ